MRELVPGPCEALWDHLCVTDCRWLTTILYLGILVMEWPVSIMVQVSPSLCASRLPGPTLTRLSCEEIPRRSLPGLLDHGMGSSTGCFGRFTLVGWLNVRKVPPRRCASETWSVWSKVLLTSELDLQPLKLAFSLASW